MNHDEQNRSYPIFTPAIHFKLNRLISIFLVHSLVFGRAKHRVSDRRLVTLNDSPSDSLISVLPVPWLLHFNDNNLYSLQNLCNHMCIYHLLWC
jgi:hypothetical protein